MKYGLKTFIIQKCSNADTFSYMATWPSNTVNNAPSVHIQLGKPHHIAHATTLAKPAKRAPLYRHHTANTINTLLIECDYALALTPRASLSVLNQRCLEARFPHNDFASPTTA